MGVGLAIAGALFSWVAFAVLLVVAGLVGAFFRDPDREVPQGQGLVVSPADGKVVLIETTPEGHYAGAGRTQISIFLSILDVHVNRAPVAGTVSGVDYHSGSFLPAFDDKASLRNEQNRVVLEHGAGQVGVTQIAGIIARRIVFRPTVGDHLERGERFGLIRFGSRLDVFLPTGTTVHATVGDKVRGGTSVLADLRGADSRPEGRQP
jgi:phosphatidylserine decarboxylase